MLASAALSDSCNSHVSFVLVSFGKLQRFSVTPAPLKSPSPRQPQPHAFVLCLWAVILLSFLFSWHSFFFYFQIRWGFWERIKNVRLWKANSIWKCRSRFTGTIKNRFHIKCSSGASVPPRSNDSYVANKSTESPMTHKCTPSLWRGLFHISIHTVATLLPILIGEERPAGSPPWDSTPFCHLPLKKKKKKNLDASPATDPAANKWREEKWPPRQRTRQMTPASARFMSPACRPWLSNVERWLIVCKPQEANHPQASEPPFSLVSRSR